MTIRLYCDEDSIQHALVASLRKRGVDIQTALEAGTVGQPDERQLEYAAAHGRALCSFNVADFFRLHAEWVARQRSHAGIVLARQQHYSIGEQMRRLLRLLASVSAEEMRNRLEFLSDWGPHR